MDAIRRVSKPWGFEIWWAVGEQYTGKLLHVEQGQRLSLQYHKHTDESCYVLSGRVRLTKEPSVEKLSTEEKSAGDWWRNRPGEIHSLEALETSSVLEASTPHLDDFVRLINDYGRVGQAPNHEPDVVAHRGKTDQPSRLLDRDLIAAKLQLRRDEVSAVVNDPGFPSPVGYFRGRILWEEAAVEAWQAPETSALRTAAS
jgi:mannose-6-phosphate isomerase